MTKRRLYEAGALVETKTSRGTWPIRIITEGKGSSATYLREMLEDPKNHIFGNRPMFGNHPKDINKPWERSPFEIKAKLGPEIEYRVVDGVAGLYGEAIVDEEVDRFLEKFHDVVQVSIFASGEGKDVDGEWFAESFDPEDPYTSVDFVVAAGRGGGVERVQESFRALESTAPAAADTEREKRMDEALKAFLEAFEARINDKLAELSTKVEDAAALVESIQEAQPERLEATEVAGELATAVAEAKLGEKAVKRVLESVKDGKSVADAVKHETDIRDEVLAESGKFTEGYFGGNETATADDFKVSGLRFN